MSVPNCLIQVVVWPLLWNSLELTQALVRDVGVYEGHFVPPKEQRPPPLVVSLKLHDAINKSKLVDNIIIVHLVIVIVGQAQLNRRKEKSTYFLRLPLHTFLWTGVQVTLLQLDKII